MTPREIIARHLCTMAAHDWAKITPFQRAAFRTTAGGIIEALNSADYVHGPTVEKCAAVVEEKADSYADPKEVSLWDCAKPISVRLYGAATAIRALAKERQG